MGHIGGDRADLGVALPPGWVEIDPGEADGYAGGRLVQFATVAAWDRADRFRPTMSVAVAPPTADHIAVRVLAEAQASLVDVHVVSIDQWTVPGTGPPGRRLVFAHVDGEVTLTTLVWVTTTAAGEVIVTAHAESTDLHRHDPAFTRAVAGIRLPGGAAPAVPPGTADLAKSARTAPWADVVPVTEGGRTAMVADPDARILVEASVRGTSLRFDATVAGDRATVSATASPRALADHSPGGTPGPTSFRIPVTRLALAVAQWLGLGPAWTPATDPVTVPMSLVMNRLVDPSVPPPPGVDPTMWRQPWFLWTLRSSATDSGLVMVDTGTSGQCAVMETEDEQATRFAPLSGYNVWLTLNWLVSESLAG